MNNKGLKKFNKRLNQHSYGDSFYEARSKALFL